MILLTLPEYIPENAKILYRHNHGQFITNRFGIKNEGYYIYYNTVVDRDIMPIGKSLLFGLLKISLP
jgi:hypothetical protein